jgi:hypothetical protein
MPRTSALRIPGPDIEIEVTFRASLPYVFDWCTDYQPDDARREDDEYERRILERSPKRVVFEDLGSDPKGWFWARTEVTLRSPDRWHADRRGNRSEILADYQLTALGPESTKLVMRTRRRPVRPNGTTIPPAARRKALTKMWTAFGRHLEADFRTEKRISR